MNKRTSRLENFFSTYNSKRTIQNYKAFLKNYFLTFYEGPYNEQGKATAFSLEAEVDKYFEHPRDYEQDVKDFYEIIKQRPPMSVKVLVSVVKTFLLENEIELPTLFWRRLHRRRNGNRAVTQDPARAD